MAKPAADEAQRIRAYFSDARWSPTKGARFLVAERRAVLETLLADVGIPTARLTVCDVGCGDGADLRRWRDLGVPEAQLFGTELVADLADTARRSIPTGVVTTADGFEVPFADHSFNLVTASLVLSTIRDRSDRRSFLLEMWRVTRPGGMLAIYDFRVRKPWNQNVAGVGTRELRSSLGRPTHTYRVAPLLPVLNLALKLPDAARAALVRVLPRTHRLWVWRRPA